MVSVVDAVCPVTDAGLKVHFARAGRPVQVSVTSSGAKETTVNPYEADCPAVTVAAEFVRVKETPG